MKGGNHEDEIIVTVSHLCYGISAALLSDRVVGPPAASENRGCLLGDQPKMKASRSVQSG